MNHTCNPDRTVLCGLPGCSKELCVQCIVNHYRTCKYRRKELFSDTINKQEQELLCSLESKTSNGSSKKTHTSRGKKNM